MQVPVFMFGALRSGTTVFRLMLDAHEDISNPGETDFIFDYLVRRENSGGWTYDLDGLKKDRIFQSQRLEIPNSGDGEEIARSFVDQLERRGRGRLCLTIHGHADKAAAIFPGCKIIHIVRDPRDVANSCVGMGWAGNTYFGIDPWIATEQNWNAAAASFDPANVIELHFEDLIANPERELGRVCQFIGVPFSPAMLNYSAKSTYSAPDRGAIEQWRSKLKPRDAALVEVKARDLLLQRGYRLSGYPLDPPRFAEKLALFWANKTYKWRFGLRRYGAVNFIMEKITRRLLRSAHAAFVQRMNEIDKRYLK